MVQLAKHPKKPLGNNGAGNVNQQFIKDLEPIIKKCGLENDADCKEKIEMVKKNDPRGYHLLALRLWTKGNLRSKEEKALFAAIKKTVDNGVEEAHFCYGSLLLFGIGEKQDIEKGLYTMKGAFLKLFSKAFAKHSLGSEMSEFLLMVFRENQKVSQSISKATTDEDLQKAYIRISHQYCIISLVLQNAFSIKTVK